MQSFELKRKTQGFYNYVELKGLRNVDIINKTGAGKGNVSSYMNKKLEPSKNFIEQFEESYQINLDEYVDINSVPDDLIDRVKGNRKTIDAIYDIQTIPIYDTTATLGLVEIFEGSESGNILNYVSIPNLPKSDGAIFMTGDSMYPLLKSGDIVALKIINKLDIIYGEMYYVEYYGEDGDMEFKAIKYVKKSVLGNDYIQLVSYNQHHEPKDIYLSRIKTIAIVNASVRYNRL